VVNNYKWSSFIALIILILLFNSIHAVESIVINSDNNYLSFEYNEYWDENRKSKSATQLRPLRVYQEKYNKYSGNVIYAYNPEFGKDDPAMFSMLDLNSMIPEDDPVNLIINDWDLYKDTKSFQVTIASAGYKRDSVFAFSLNPTSEHKKEVFLCLSKDTISNGIWEPAIEILLLEDYDFDNNNEIFVYINSVRDSDLRMLFCIELETMKIEWSLPLASIPNKKMFFSCNDSLNPSILFSSYNTKQGVKDSVFDDYFGYLTKINHKGNILFNEIVSIQHGMNYLKRSLNNNLFYLTHEVGLGCDIHYDTTWDGLCNLSIIDSDVKILKTTIFNGSPADMWLIDFNTTNKPTLYLTTRPKIIYAYDTLLNLVAMSDTIEFYDYIGQIKIPSVNNICNVFSDGIYDLEFNKLVKFPFPISYFNIFERNEKGEVQSIVIGHKNICSIGKITKRNLISLLSIFYHKNQIYVLMFVSGLLVLLIMINYIRFRTRQNLEIITNQKKELEKLHHDLKDTQQKLIEMEKFKQAKDIAGGFAHEIRNALLPSESRIYKIKNSNKSISNIYESITPIEKSINRALDITNLISQYTKLDSEYKTDKTDLTKTIDDVIKSNQNLFENSNINLKIDGKEKISVNINEIHLYMILNNLVLNSIDSLTKRDNPVIFIKYRPFNDLANIIVEDNGCGIEKENLINIFNVFYSTKPNKGQGIGLSTVKKLTEMYDGSITVESEINKWTRFELNLLRS